LSPAIRPALLQNLSDLYAAAEVPSCNKVRVDIVVDIIVVFVRADDVSNVVSVVGFHCTATSPEASGFQHDLGAPVQQELIISRGIPVLPNGKRDVGGDVNLHFAVRNPYD